MATSKFHDNAVALLSMCGLLDFFDLVVGTDQVSRPKPDREMADLILRTCRVTADRAVMVGDTTHDLQMAHAAGMRSVAVTYGVHSAQQLAAQNPTWAADTFDKAIYYIVDESLSPF